MSNNGVDRRRLALLGGLAWAASGLLGEAQAQSAAASSVSDLPAEVTTHHTIELAGRTLRFAATAGALPLQGENNAPRAELAFIAFQLDGADALHRPVTFAFNGGPGFASAWLNIGAVGPWRMSLAADAIAASASPETIPNAETWLDFTDLVFIDPAGTGYSRVLDTSDHVRRRLFSVEGDIAYLAEAIRHWLDRSDRTRA